MVPLYYCRVIVFCSFFEKDFLTKHTLITEFHSGFCRRIQKTETEIEIIATNTIESCHAVCSSGYALRSFWAPSRSHGRAQRGHAEPVACTAAQLHSCTVGRTSFEAPAEGLISFRQGVWGGLYSSNIQPIIAFTHPILQPIIAGSCEVTLELPPVHTRQMAYIFSPPPPPPHISSAADAISPSISVFSSSEHEPRSKPPPQRSSFRQLSSPVHAPTCSEMHGGGPPPPREPPPPVASHAPVGTQSTAVSNRTCADNDVQVA